MGMQHLFQGEIAWLVPVIIVAVIVGRMVIGSLMGERGGFERRGRGYGMKGRRYRRGMLVGDVEEKPASAPSSSQAETQRRPAKPSEAGKRAESRMQAQVDKAHAYQEQIDQLVKSTSKQSARARMQDLAAQVGEWVTAIEDLAKRIDSFHQNTLIQQDMKSVPKAIEQLEARLEEESNDEVTRFELERTLDNRKDQLAALERLRDITSHAEIKIESTLSALGTIYSQLLTAQSTDEVADYSRLSAEVDEEVHVLQDHLEALEEVKLGR